MRSALALALWLINYNALAETYMTLGFTHHHKDKQYCEVHPGVFGEWRWNDVRTFVGIHQKSDCEPGGVGGIAWQPLRYEALSAGVMVMALTNYEEHPVIVTPAPAFSYQVQKNVGVDVTGWPNKLWHVRWRFAF